MTKNEQRRAALAEFLKVEAATPMQAFQRICYVGVRENLAVGNLKRAEEAAATYNKGKNIIVQNPFNVAEAFAQWKAAAQAAL